ncbi:MAG: hypothetical protein JXD23_13965 [Spirochaetales bacterium]|nr:hypothetical protein [Spirochaetales bacterium]
MRGSGPVCLIISFLFIAGCRGDKAETTRNIADIVSVTAHSELSVLKDRYRYAGWKAMDGDPATAWVEGADGPGSGESIAVAFSGRVKIDRIDLRPGYYDKRWYGENNRIKKIEIAASDAGFSGLFDLSDGMDVKTVKLPGEIRTSSVVFTKRDVYPGSVHDDTCLAEIEFYYGEKRPLPWFKDLHLLSGVEKRYRKNFDGLARKYPGLFNGDPAGKKFETFDFMIAKTSGDGLMEEECLFKDKTYFRRLLLDEGIVWAAGVWAKDGSRVRATVNRRLTVSGVDIYRNDEMHLNRYYREYKIEESAAPQTTSFDWNERLMGIIEHGFGLEEYGPFLGTFLKKIRRERYARLLQAGELEGRSEAIRRGAGQAIYVGRRLKLGKGPEVDEPAPANEFLFYK